MAIKGKGRTRGRRAVAAPPKRAVVVRKPPIWRRRWVWLAVGVAAGVGIVAGILAAIHVHKVATPVYRDLPTITAYVIQCLSDSRYDGTSGPSVVIRTFTTLP